MTDPVTVTFDGNNYSVPPMNIGQLRRVAKLRKSVDTDPGDLPFKILEIALERADPSTGQFDEITASQDEVFEACNKVMAGAGMHGPDKEPATGEAQPALQPAT